jgi:hypothetical protein
MCWNLWIFKNSISNWCFFCNTRFGWNKRIKKLYNFYLEIFKEILYIILSKHNRLSFIKFDKKIGHLLLWFDAHIYNLWEYILVKKKWFCKLFVGLCIELVKLHLCKVVYWKNAMNNNVISWACECECELVNMNRWVGWNLCEFFWWNGQNMLKIFFATEERIFSYVEFLKTNMA